MTLLRAVLLPVETPSFCQWLDGPVNWRCFTYSASSRLMRSLIGDHLRSGGSSFLSSTPGLTVGLTTRTKRWNHPSAAWSSRAHLPGGWSMSTIIDQLCDRRVHLPVCLVINHPPSKKRRLPVRHPSVLTSLGLSSFCTPAAVTPPGPTDITLLPPPGGAKGVALEWGRFPSVESL